MFKQFQNIESAFKHIRLFSLLFLIANCVVTCFVLHLYYKDSQTSKNRVYLIANGKLLDAVAVNRSDNIMVELRDHVKMFHLHFYNLEPDDEVIKRNLNKALYLADGRAKAEYDNLREQGYYSSLISANISQRAEDPDSIYVDLNQSPYYFKYYGKLRIIRATTKVSRSLITEGYLRGTQRSDNNPHGFLIERWHIIENKDLKIENR